MVKVLTLLVLFVSLLGTIFIKDKITFLATRPYMDNMSEIISRDTSHAASSVLGDSTSKKRIEVDLTRQKVMTFENDQKIHEFTISSGKWDRTPTGEYKIWAKVPKQKMSGGSKILGTYYYLPSVPHIMFFYNDKVKKQLGYSFHGTYWHNNFGYPMSHGCINMKTAEAKILYDWADLDTDVSIYGKYQYKSPLKP